MRHGSAHRAGARSTGWALALAAAAVLAAILPACAEEDRGEDHPPGILHFPGALAVDSSGRYLYVVNTNFDLAYRGGSVVAVDLITHEVQPDSAIQVGTFPGRLVLNNDEEGQTVAGYLPDRDANALAWFRVERADGVPSLRCNAQAAGSGIETCTDEFVVGERTVNGTQLVVGDNPFGAGIQKMGVNQDDLLFTGTLIDGRFAIYRLADDGEPQLIRNVQLQPGLHGIATSQATGFTYVSSHFASQIYTLRVTDAAREVAAPPGLDVDAEVPVPEVAAAAINIQNVSAITDYGHGLALSPDGTRAYIAYRSPSSVLVIDAGLGEDGQPRNRVLGFVGVGSRPTELAVLPRADGKGDLIYVACFGTNNVYVVDSLLMDVVDVIPTGVGPYDIAVVDDELVGRRAYVSLFEEHAIAVIDLDPASPFYHQVIAEIR